MGSFLSNVSNVGSNSHGSTCSDAEMLKGQRMLLEPVIAAMDLLRGPTGVPLDLMKDEGEYLATTLGLTLEEDTVSYIIPAGPAHLEGIRALFSTSDDMLVISQEYFFLTSLVCTGSIRIGDRIVAIDGKDEYVCVGGG